MVERYNCLELIYRDKRATALFLCDCGKVLRRNYYNVKSGATKSCSCHRSPFSSDGRKRCPACLEFKQLCDFSTHNQQRSGVSSSCKACDAVRRRRYPWTQKDYQSRRYKRWARSYYNKRTENLGDAYVLQKLNLPRSVATE